MIHFDTLARDGSGDFDGDGQSDMAEFRAGTNPSNNTSVLRVVSISVSGAFSSTLSYVQTRLLWTAASGKTYRVQFKEDVRATWTDLPGDVTAAGTTASKTHAVFAGPSRSFYRVVLVP